MALWKNEKQIIENDAVNWGEEVGVQERGEESGNSQIYCQFRDELGWGERVVDLRLCSPNIWKTQEKTVTQGERRAGEIKRGKLMKDFMCYIKDLWILA